MNADCEICAINFGHHYDNASVKMVDGDVLAGIAGALHVALGDN